MKLIFGTDRNFSIGVDGDMLFHLKEDLARFKSITLGNICIMGRKTLESLPGGRPLPGRTNIVLSNNPSYEPPKDVLVVRSYDELQDLLLEINPDYEKDEFLIGGGKLVFEWLEHCDTAYITMVDKVYEDFDTWIPNLREDPEWELVEESDVREEQGLRFTYQEYRRKKR